MKLDRLVNILLHQPQPIHTIQMKLNCNMLQLLLVGLLSMSRRYQRYREAERQKRKAAGAAGIKYLGGLTGSEELGAEGD